MFLKKHACLENLVDPKARQWKTPHATKLQILQLGVIQILYPPPLHKSVSRSRYTCVLMRYGGGVAEREWEPITCLRLL